MAAADSPRRWLLLGSGGSGKSTLARALAARLDLPLVHLDREYWRAGWDPTPKPEWRARVEELAGRDAWVMDGNYSGTLDIRMPRADVVVLLDLNPVLCLWRITKRRWLDPHRTDIPEDCPDRLDLEFLHWVASYRWRSLPRVRKRIAENPHLKVFVLRSRKEVRHFLDHI